MERDVFCYWNHHSSTVPKVSNKDFLLWREQTASNPGSVHPIVWHLSQYHCCFIKMPEYFPEDNVNMDLACGTFYSIQVLMLCAKVTEKPNIQGWKSTVKAFKYCIHQEKKQKTNVQLLNIKCRYIFNLHPPDPHKQK